MISRTKIQLLSVYKNVGRINNMILRENLGIMANYCNKKLIKILLVKK